ncbi:MAG: RidA family protein [Kiloniellales bacterium]|nr:RidA family protein [Kiloniellales bacterium]
MSIQRLDIGPRMSQVVVHDGTVYTAGLVADDWSKDVAGQAQEILAKIDAYLGQVGSDKSKLLRVEIWLPDIGDFNAFNAVYDAWVDKANPPVRACVESKLASPDIKVEIMAIAAA